MMKKFTFSEIAIMLFIVAIIVYMAIVGFYTYFPARDNVRINIVDIQRVCQKNNCYWMVYDKNGKIYKVQDLWLIGYINAGDVAGKLMSHKGDICIVDTRGSRIRILSLYPTITKVEKCFNNNTK